MAVFSCLLLRTCVSGPFSQQSSVMEKVVFAGRVALIHPSSCSHNAKGFTPNPPHTQTHASDHLRELPRPAYPWRWLWIIDFNQGEVSIFPYRGEQSWGGDSIVDWYLQHFGKVSECVPQSSRMCPQGCQEMMPSFIENAQQNVGICHYRPPWMSLYWSFINWGDMELLLYMQHAVKMEL